MTRPLMVYVCASQGTTCEGIVFEGKICGVSALRAEQVSDWRRDSRGCAGASGSARSSSSGCVACALSDSARQEQDEETVQAKLFYSKVRVPDAALGRG